MAQKTAVMQLINFILVERRQDDGSIKFHANDDFGKFLQMEKEQIMNAWEDGKGAFSTRQPEQYYNEQYGGLGSPDTTTSPNTQNK